MKYDPYVEYMNRKNKTAKRRERDMREHQFSDSIGGHASNYRAPKRVN